MIFINSQLDRIDTDLEAFVAGQGESKYLRELVPWQLVSIGETEKRRLV